MYYPPASLIATGVVFALLCLVSTALRFWVRLSYSRGPIGVDDGLIVLAALIVIAFDAVQDVQVADNLRHGDTSDVKSSSDPAVIAAKINYVQLITEKIAFGCIKLSFLIFYRRIFGLWPSFKRINSVLIAIVTAWAFAYMMSAIFVCGTHPEAQWDFSNREEKCYNQGSVLFSYAITDVATDLAVLSLPLFYVRRLQMSRRKKWAIVGVFLLGFLCVHTSTSVLLSEKARANRFRSTLAGILRLAFLSVYFSLHQFDWNPPTLEHPPKILSIISPTFWTNLELTCGVVAANLPPLWPLIHNAPSFGHFCAATYRKLSNSSQKYGSSIKSWARRDSSANTTTTSVVTEK